uniref:CYTOSOL_AP domain-containing protein n=2 Tax=Macrostomum lignano TaxID=282301 RepID=A0A1I8J601_9PLAT
MCSIEPCSLLQQSNYDCIIIVGDNPLHLGQNLSAFSKTIQHYCAKNCSIMSPKSTTFVPCSESVAPAGRLVFAHTGPLNRDFDDSRSLYDAAQRGIELAISAGSRSPLLCRAWLGSLPSDQWSMDLNNLDRCIALGALQAVYCPLEVREATGNRNAALVGRLGYLVNQEDDATAALVAQRFNFIRALESGRQLARDIGGSDPERMSPGRIADRLASEFGVVSNGPVVMEIEESIKPEKYPLMAAVDRGSVERHRGKVVHLTYEGELNSRADAADRSHVTLLLAGKGVTFDSGGLSLKTGGSMVGMHRDKCGAAAVAGLFSLLAQLRPPNLTARCSLGLVRNSIGSGSYSPDEVIVSRAGRRVRVVNTDAEGRMILADLLCLQRERALELAEPSRARLFTVATLTGHAVLAYGQGYSIAMDNGPARRLGVAAKLQAAGDLIADPFEISTVRREDWDFVRSSGPYEELLQCNPQPSAATPRGHQFPAAFLAAASGLDK